MSTNPRTYLDFNATAPLAPAARDAIAGVLADGGLGNPSSIHGEGRRARDYIERARNQVAGLLGRPREQIVFTSGGTEANVVGVRTLAAIAEARGMARTVYTTRLEHPSLLGAVRGLGWRVVDSPAEASVIAVAAVNHELGTVQEIPAGALVHVDAVQAAGKLPLVMAAQSIAISAHKLGGPQGVGAVALSIDHDENDPSTGHQERGRRGGTENLLGIVGFGAVAATVDPATWKAVADLGDELEAGILQIPGTRIHGADRPRVGGTINAGFEGARGESIVIALDLAGIAAST